MDYINLMTCILTKAISPVIIDYIHNVYEKPSEYISEPDKPIPTPSLINFQNGLKKVPNMSSAQVTNFVNEIEKKCHSFKNYKDSIYIAYVKLVSNAIKTKSESRKINIKPPTNELFVHQCFILAAHNFYENPYIMKEQNETKREAEILDRVKFCISEAISDSIPFCDILGEYLNDDSLTDETSVENLMNPLGEQKPEESGKEDVNTESPITESPFPEGEPTKEVPLEKKEEDVLFGDAPEKVPQQ